MKYLGIGPAAHSFDGRERHWNVSSVERYIAGDAPEAEILSEHDRFNEYVMTRLRTVEGIDLKEATALFGPERCERMMQEAAGWIHAGILLFDNRRLAIPPARMLVSDAVIEELFET